MEKLTITQSGSELHIEEFPDARKVVALSGHTARRIADLTLHIQDLEFARDAIMAINDVAPLGENIQEALWRSAVIHFAKCFGKGTRSQLSPNKVYKSEPKEALDCYYHFRHLRDKHIAHDVNSYTQALPGAIINDGTKAYKVEKIVSFSAHATTLDQQHFETLHSLIDVALNWAIEEHDNLCELLTKELETEDYDTVLNRPALSYTVPDPADISTPRTLVTY